MKYYTICLVGLPSRQAIVVGGGAVAARKVEGLLEAGAQVKVISPLLTRELQLIASAGVITFLPRPYQDGDLEDAYLVIAATDDPTINQSVWM